ncbi:MAG: DUF3352 domain-containing protein [Pirellulaceae bacterium]|nr:DUF3352 domain-containing protein [Pirellulaceae bacterium]
MWRAKAICLVLILLVFWVSPAPAADTAAPATALIPPDAVLVVRVTQPQALIDRLFDQRVVKFVQTLPPYREALANPETQQALTLLDFFKTKYNVDAAGLLRKLVGGGITLAVSPQDRTLLIVDADDDKMLAEMHDFFRTIAKTEAGKQGHAERVASADYRGITGWTFAPGESHAIVGNRLLLSNKPEGLKDAIDRLVDQSGQDVTKSARYEAAIASLRSEPQVVAYADMSVLKQLPDFQRGLTQDDNPMTRLLFAPLLAAINDSTWLAAGITVGAETVDVNLQADRSASAGTAPHAFALPQQAGQGAMPHAVVPGQIAGISLYRDLHQFYAAKDELFPDRTSGLIFFENMMGIFFSGKDLTNDVLAQTLPDIRVVVAQQKYDEKTGTPALQFPAFAVIVQLRDPERFAPVVEEAWQKAIGLINFTRGQQALPGLMIKTEDYAGMEYTTSYFSVADEQNKDATDVRFNFRPAFAVAGDRLILSSTDPLARDLIDALQREREQAVPPVDGQHSLVKVQSAPLAAVLEANREALIRQNMMENGASREEAEQSVGGLFLVLQYVTGLEMAAGTREDRSEMTIQLQYALPH